MSAKKQTYKSKATARGKTAQKKTPTVLWAGILAVLALVIVGAAWAFGRGSSGEATLEGLPSEISIAQAHEMYQEGAFVLDVRTPEEWNEFHAPNTTLIPLDQLAKRVDELPRDQEIVVVCRSGNRSATGRDILLDAGFNQVTSMAGGLTAWRTAGYLTVTGP